MNPSPRLRAATAAAAAAVVALAGLVTLPAAPAQAASRVTVVNDRGGADADTTYRTAMTVSGTGFQGVQGGFGGVYVMFGWVDDAAGGTWRPSRGGLTGQDYRYVPDSEDAADNQGYLRFVAFPGSSTAAEANAVMTGSGRFSVDLTVPGPVFESVDRDGEVARVDCRTATCGVITIGAHGVTSARNETFTRVRFADVYGAAAAPSASPAAPTRSAGAAATTPTDPDTSAPAAAPAAPAAPAGPGDPVDGEAVDQPTAATADPVVTTDRSTAVTGHALAFTGRGFTAGEQVLAVLDDGVAAVGPLVAGSSGEVAGLLQLPTTLAVGTHTLRLTGAASAAGASENFPVRAATATQAPVEEAAADGSGPPAASVFLALSALLLLLALADLARRLRSRRSRTRAAAPVGATS